MRKFTYIGLIMLLSSGCSSLAPPPYDPMTLKQIDVTLRFEEADYAASRAALELCGAGTALLELQIRHDSEMVRLRAWKQSEEAKKIVVDEEDE